MENNKYSENKKRRIALRQQILEKRRNLSALDIEDGGYKVAQELLKHERLQKNCIIGSYVSACGELSSRPIHKVLFEMGHTLSLPRIDMDHKGLMDFFIYKKDDELIENRFHILEPAPIEENYLSFDRLEVLIVPLVAFDKKGNRLGMGGGFCDRALKKISSQCLTIGVGYDFQCLDNIPIEHWDMPLDEIITPTNHYIFKN